MNHSRTTLTALALLASIVAACGELPTDFRDRGLAADGVRATARPTFGLPIVTRVTVTPVSGGMDTTTWTLVVGSTEQFKATGYDPLGSEATGSTTYRSSNTAVLAVDASTGLATAVAAGTAEVSATINSATGRTRTITVTAAPPPPPTTGTNTVALSIVRFDGGSGVATVSSAIPLAPGALRPGAEGRVRLVVDDVERRLYVQGLSSLHADGSLRAVLVQFQLPALGAAQTLAGTLVLGSERPAMMTQDAPFVRPGAATSGTPGGLPQAAALPSEVPYLLATDLVGPTAPSATTSSLGGDFARYESDFQQYADYHWSSEGDQWDVANYYDRALIYYAMWVRTANPTFWMRAGRLAYQYRVGYLQANDYGSSPHWAQLEGLEKHYLLTGDDSSRVAVLNTATILNAFINTEYMSRENGESRIAARVLHAQLLAWRLSPAGAAGASFRGGNSSTFDWENGVDAALAKITAWQQPDGSYPADGQACGGQLNYMIGLLNDALIKTYDYYLPTASSRAAVQSNIRTLVRRGVDYLWTTQWRAADQSFNYASVECSSAAANGADVGGPDAAPDLNNMISASFGWMYKQTGDATYRTRGDQIFSGGVTQAFLSGSKQFNESYTSSFRYLGYR